MGEDTSGNPRLFAGEGARATLVQTFPREFTTEDAKRPTARASCRPVLIPNSLKLIYIELLLVQRRVALDDDGLLGQLFHFS
jgi:hypothetical protein